MKTLVVFYSRTNTTKKVAENLASLVSGELEEIKAVKDRRGLWGYIFSGWEALKKIPAKIEPTTKNPASYDLVIFGTPIWAGNVASPVRAYLKQQKNNIKKAAFFCVMGGSGSERAFADMTQILDKTSVITLTLLTEEVVENNFTEKIKKFVAQLVD